jgi:hypothetical protein
MTTSTTGSEPAASRRGAALVEVLVAVLVLFGGIVAVAQAYGTTLRALADTADALAADETLRRWMAGIEWALGRGAGAGDAVTDGALWAEPSDYRLESHAVPVAARDLALRLDDVELRVRRAPGGAPHVRWTRVAGAPAP